MCGFVGEVNLDKDYTSRVVEANKKLYCRGPDNQSYCFVSSENKFISDTKHDLKQKSKIEKEIMEKLLLEAIHI